MTDNPVSGVGRVVKGVAVVLLAFLGLTYVAFALGFDPAALYRWTERASVTIAPYQVLLLALRWCVFLGVWWRWQSLVKRWFHSEIHAYELKREVWMALRHRVLAVWVVLELCMQFSR